jgi:hypothetical protein
MTYPMHLKWKDAKLTRRILSQETYIIKIIQHSEMLFQLRQENNTWSWDQRHHADIIIMIIST